MFKGLSYKIELLKEDNSSIFLDLKEKETLFDGNQIKCHIIENHGKYSVFAEVFLAKGYKGYSFVCDLKFDDLFDDSLFFAPSAFYGDIHKKSKMMFANNICGSGVDYLSAPIVCFYRDGHSYVLKDLTPGKRETVGEDSVIGEKTKIVVSDKFDLPGLGIVKQEDNIVLQHRYPAHTYNNIKPGYNLFRYSNANVARFSFELIEKQNNSFDDFMNEVWREQFDSREHIDNGVDTGAAIKEVIKYACRGYGIRNNEPQFCVNTDHYTNESGFLYRNADLAELLLRYKYDGYDVSLSFEQLIAVLDSQVNNEYAGAKQVWPFSRSRYEGVFAVLQAYLLLKEHGVNKPQWWEFILKEASLCLKDDDYFSIPLLVGLYNITKKNEYLNAAERKARYLWENKVSVGAFYGGIVDFIGEPPLDKETGVCSLDAFICLYEVTKNPQYLEYAKKSAIYAETHTQLYSINLEPKDYDDTDDYCHLGHGNAHVNTQGLSYVASTCAIGDFANLFYLFDYVKLAEYTGDKHFLEFAKFVYINSFNIVNLDDKTGGMDDYVYNSGIGFAPEYIALAASCDPASFGRGRMHDSDIAWVIYGLLSNGYFFETNKKYKPNNKLDKRYKVIKVEDIRCYPNKCYPNNLLIGGRTTFFNAKQSKSIIMTFKEKTHIDKLVVSYHDPSVSCSYLIETLCSTTIRQETYRHHSGNYYDVVELDDDVTYLTISFESDDDLFLCGIIPFGITDNVINEYGVDKKETFVDRWLKNEVQFFDEDKPIEFNYRTNTFVGENVEFLRAGMLRANSKKPVVKFKLDKENTVFWFRKSKVEKCEGDVFVSLNLNGKKELEQPITNKTSYFKLHGVGDVELRFDVKNKNTIEFGYLELEKEGL